MDEHIADQFKSLEDMFDRQVHNPVRYQRGFVEIYENKRAFGRFDSENWQYSENNRNTVQYFMSVRDKYRTAKYIPQYEYIMINSCFGKELSGMGMALKLVLCFAAYMGNKTIIMRILQLLPHTVVSSIIFSKGLRKGIDICIAEDIECTKEFKSSLARYKKNIDVRVAMIIMVNPTMHQLAGIFRQYVTYWGDLQYNL